MLAYSVDSKPNIPNIFGFLKKPNIRFIRFHYIGGERRLRGPRRVKQKAEAAAEEIGDDVILQQIDAEEAADIEVERTTTVSEEEV